MSILNNITKTIDLENNDGLSSILFHAAQQNHNAYEAFYELFSSVRPVRILEIGTALGGFTAYMDLACKEIGIHTKIRSYDIHSHSWYDDLRLKNIDVIIDNIFTDNYTDLKNYSVIDFIKDDGLCLVLCDGGNKKQEFNILSRYLKINDIIMAHDYAPNTNYFQSDMNRKIWNWHEIQDTDIQESIQNNGLHPYMREKMLSVAWACFIKKE